TNSCIGSEYPPSSPQPQTDCHAAPFGPPTMACRDVIGPPTGPPNWDGKSDDAEAAGVVAGAVAGLACEAAATASGWSLSPVCAALAGGVGSLVTYLAGRPKNEWNGQDATVAFL